MRMRSALRVRHVIYPPALRVKPETPVLQRGDVVTDDYGVQWRILYVTPLGCSRVRVGSIAEQIIFGDE